MCRLVVEMRTSGHGAENMPKTYDSWVLRHILYICKVRQQATSIGRTLVVVREGVVKNGRKTNGRVSKLAYQNAPRQASRRPVAHASEFTF